MSKTCYIIGIDEVGRGSLAGPVTVAAVAMPQELKMRACVNKNTNNKDAKPIPLRDSKKLTAKARESWLAALKNDPRVVCSVSHVQPAKIDKINISNAANLAAYRALQKIVMSKRRLAACGGKVFLDGGLYARDSAKKISFLLPSRTVIRGDEKVATISLASIVAKVRRDALMKRLDKKYPGYGFAIHKGYGTKNHLAAIKRRGISGAHRVSFC